MRTVDLYCGCGGMSLGFSNAGFQIVAAFDNWKAAVETYRYNFPDHIAHLFDLSNTNTAANLVKSARPKVIIGGPPCQDFSSAGKRDENGGRADLTIEFAKITSIISPTYFVMENVDRIIKSNTLKRAKAIYKEAGYGLTERILDASLCGAPQLRKRYFLIGELNGSDDFLSFEISKNLASRQMTLRDYFGNKLGVTCYYRHPRSYKRRGIFSIDEPSPTIRGVNRPIPPGYPGHPGDAASITEDVRPLTTQERAMIQTFPEDFKFLGGKAEQELMIGNAVPVKLAEFLGRAIMEYEKRKQAYRFAQRRRQKTHDEIGEIKWQQDH